MDSNCNNLEQKMIIAAYISHVERSEYQGFVPLTLAQFNVMAKRINRVPVGWDKG